MKKIIISCICVCLCFPMLSFKLFAKEESETMDLAPNAKAAYLVENTTGMVIFAKHEKDKLYPASMTKMMGLLLIYESLHNGRLSSKDSVTTSAYAASMGGSQVFLEENESLSVNDMLKSICIASANDAMVAMGEKIGGSNDNFVKMMNDRGKELKLENTNFTNVTGLHDSEHYTCAKDMATIARALLAEGGEELLKITSTYDAYIREKSDKAFWLVNTNKLLKQYPGVDGLKSGFTSQALSCITVSAKKNDLRLISVVMGEPDSKVRNAETKQLLDFGFSQYSNGLLYPSGKKIKSYTLENGKPAKVNLITLKDASYVFKKGSESKEVKKEIVITKKNLPYKKGETIGHVHIEMSDGYHMEVEIGVDQDVALLNYTDIFMKAFQNVFA